MPFSPRSISVSSVAAIAYRGAGVAGLFFSDQEFPNRCGYLPGKRVVPVEEMLARIVAALDARTDPQLMIVGRTDVYGVEGLDAAIESARLALPGNRLVDHLAICATDLRGFFANNS